jgi:hypothetical protein
MSSISLRSAVALIAFAAPALALACDEDGHAAKVKKVSIVELADLQKSGKVTPVDANGTDIRSKQGSIPGAVLLTNAMKYDAKELPAAKDAKLVFYCANTRCTASHQPAMPSGRMLTSV